MRSVDRAHSCDCSQLYEYLLLRHSCALFSDHSSLNLNMVSFNDPNAFADPEDSALVAEAKKHVEPPLEYNYTEVRGVVVIAGYNAD